MKSNKLEDLTIGTILTLKKDGGYMAGCGFRFNKIVNQDVLPMAEGVINGKVEWIGATRLEGVTHD